jgi:tRNA(Arg) A34 adenosine deaminase TadA
MSDMDLALDMARAAASAGEIPVGAVISDLAGVVLAATSNRTEQEQNPAAHAEMLALQAASKNLGQKYFTGCTLTVTLEPCAMCAGAIAAFRVQKLVFAAYDPKSGAVEHGPRVFSHATTHHRPEIIGGVREQEANALLKAFFSGLRG